MEQTPRAQSFGAQQLPRRAPLAPSGGRSHGAYADARPSYRAARPDAFGRGSHSRLRAQDPGVQGIAQARVNLPPAQPLTGHGLQARPRNGDRQGVQRRQRRCSPAAALRAALGVRMQLQHSLPGVAQAVAGARDRCRARHSIVSVSQQGAESQNLHAAAAPLS